MSKLSRFLPQALCAAVAGMLVIAAVKVRPYPFATTDDNWMYFLPLIKTHTDALLSGRFLTVLWGVGAGWSPWENAQAGILYLPYHLANLLARAIHHPLAILEVSAWMHLAAAGMITHGFSPSHWRAPERWGWTLAAMALPGPVIIGLNWHNYLSCYPWFLGLAFMLHQIIHAPGMGPSRAERLWLGFLSLGFLLSAHIQMYVIGIGLLFLWALAEVPRVATARRLVPFLVSQFPALVPLIFLKVLSMEGTPDWMGDRGDPYYLLRHAQSLGTVIHGTVFGNLLYTRDFSLWANIAWTGVGMFFSPALALLPKNLWETRTWVLAFFFAFGLLFMGAASAPWLRHMAIGPLEGFRWTWKLAVFIGPLALASSLPRIRPRPAVAWAAALLSIAVCYRGLSFEIWPSLAAAHTRGAAGLVQETRAMARATGLPPGARITLLGPLDMVQTLPLPVLGLVGNAPILSGLGTAHIYEPMEPKWVSEAHLGLSLPWRTALGSSAWTGLSPRLKQALARIGVHAAITVDPHMAGNPEAIPYKDTLGRTLWVIPIPDSPPAPYPSAAGPALAVDAAGVLHAAASPTAPAILSPRAVAWAQKADGSWEGIPEGLGLGWAGAALLGTLVAFTALAWDRWNAPEDGDLPSTGS